MKNIHPQTFFILIPLYGLPCFSVYYLDNYSLNYLIGFLLSWIIIGGIGLELTHHRYWSHNQFKVNKLTEWIISYIGCLSLHGSPMFWRSHHIMHHRFTDVNGDPHSPVNGFFHATIGWSIDKENVSKVNFKYAGKKMLTDPFQLALQKYYYFIVYASFLSIYLISNSFFWFCFVPAVFVSFHQGPLVNWFCHCKGKEIKISNLNSLSLLTWGLSLHDNHHNNPSAIDFSSSDTTVDFGYLLYKLTLKYV